MSKTQLTCDYFRLAASLAIRVVFLPLTFVGEVMWAYRHGQPSPWRLGAKAVACGWWEALDWWRYGRRLIHAVYASASRTADVAFGQDFAQYEQDDDTRP